MAGDAADLLSARQLEFKTGHLTGKEMLFLDQTLQTGGKNEQMEAPGLLCRVRADDPSVLASQ